MFSIWLPSVFLYVAMKENVCEVREVQKKFKLKVNINIIIQIYCCLSAHIHFSLFQFEYSLLHTIHKKQHEKSVSLYKYITYIVKFLVLNKNLSQFKQILKTWCM